MTYDDLAGLLLVIAALLLAFATFGGVRAMRHCLHSKHASINRRRRR